MKRKFALIFAAVLATGYAMAAEGLYNVGSEAQQSMPLKWSFGVDVTYDDNVNPGGGTVKDGATSTSPYVGLSFVNMTPQTTWDVYARLGALYYLDKPTGCKDIYPQARVGVNLTHRFDERLRLSSRSFLAYELEPNYAYGFATARQSGAYFFWETDNALGYRWTERMATYTGVTLTGLSYADVQNQDRFTWALYHQFRYQLTPQQTVLTLDYRYSQTTAGGLAADSSDHYATLGIEHRFSPNTILITRAGIQIHDVTVGTSTSTSNPYLEMALNSRLTEQFSLRGFVRYSVEPYDTIQQIGLTYYDFSQRGTLRVGISGDYAITPMLSIQGGVDYIPSNFNDGRRVSGFGPVTASGLSEDLVNAYIGLSVKFNDNLFGTLTYNYTNSSSDITAHNYDRNRISLGLRYQF
ncbi:MAG: outer membrane beta-barrel protein [Verrucomicrobiota bacterium]